MRTTAALAVMLWAATAGAAQATAQVMAPITELADAMPDISDLIPGAPSLKQLRSELNAPTPIAADPQQPPVR